MLTMSTLVAGCLTLLFLLQAAPAAAQNTFGNLSEKIQRGQRIIVLDEQGAVTEGTVEDVNGSTLVVNYFRGRIADPSLKTTRTFTPDQVRRVQKPGHLWDGAIKGGIVGLIPALVNIAADCYDCNEGPFAALSISVGAAAGVGIDALFGPKTLYRRESARSRVSLAPIIGRHARGFAASFRF
jgi:hypothetical protein